MFMQEYNKYIEANKKMLVVDTPEKAEIIRKVLAGDTEETKKQHEFKRLKEEHERLLAKYRNLEINYEDVFEEFRLYRYEHENESDAITHYKAELEDTEFELACANRIIDGYKETVSKIITKIEDCMSCFEDDDDGYILKKCEFEYFMREIKKEYGVEVE